MGEKLLEEKDFSSQEAYANYLHQLGRCPYCKREVKGYKPPFGSFAPEIWETLRERGIDPGTNHLRNCQGLIRR